MKSNKSNLLEFKSRSTTLELNMSRFSLIRTTSGTKTPSIRLDYSPVLVTIFCKTIIVIGLLLAGTMRLRRRKLHTGTGSSLNDWHLPMPCNHTFFSLNSGPVCIVASFHRFECFRYLVKMHTVLPLCQPIQRAWPLFLLPRASTRCIDILDTAASID